MLKPPQLLQRFELLKRRRREGRIKPQEGAAIDIKPYMPEGEFSRAALGIADEGHARAAEVHRRAVGADDHLVVTNEIFRLDSREQAAVPTGVPLRPDTAQRLRAVGYAWVPATSGPMS